MPSPAVSNCSLYCSDPSIATLVLKYKKSTLSSKIIDKPFVEVAWEKRKGKKKKQARNFYIGLLLMYPLSGGTRTPAAACDRGNMPCQCRGHAAAMHATPCQGIPTLRANRSSTKKKKIEARGRARAAQSFILDWPRASPSSPRKGRAYDVTRRPFETLDRPLAANPFRTRAEETTTINDGGSGAKTHDGYNVGEWGFFFSTLFHTNGFRPRRAYPPLHCGLDSGVILRKGPDNAKGSKVGYLAWPQCQIGSRALRGYLA